MKFTTCGDQGISGSSWHYGWLSDRFFPTKGPDAECWIHAIHACATDAVVFVVRCGGTFSKNEVRRRVGRYEYYYRFCD